LAARDWFAPPLARLRAPSLGRRAEMSGSLIAPRCESPAAARDEGAAQGDEPSEPDENVAPGGEPFELDEGADAGPDERPSEDDEPDAICGPGAESGGPQDTQPSTSARRSLALKLGGEWRRGNQGSHEAGAEEKQEPAERAAQLEPDAGAAQLERETAVDRRGDGARRMAAGRGSAAGVAPSRGVRPAGACSDGTTGAAERRIPFQPADRILFLHSESKRLFEGSISDVHLRKLVVQVDLPQRLTRIDKARPGAHAVRVDPCASLRQFELVSLFRPAVAFLDAPPGLYLNPVDPALWLELGDCIEIAKQGGAVVFSRLGYKSERFHATVTAVSWNLCRIVPVDGGARSRSRSRSPPASGRRAKPARSSGATGPAPSAGGQLSDPSVPAQAEAKAAAPLPRPHSSRWSLLGETPSLSGTEPEWVPRNTLRFRRFVQRAPPPLALALKLVPSG
jgi:hypothetical protein